MYLNSSHTLFLTLKVLFLENGEPDYVKTLPALKRLVKNVRRVYLVCPLPHSRDSLLGLLRSYKIFAPNCLEDDSMVSYYPFDSMVEKIRSIERVLEVDRVIEHACFIDTELDFQKYFCEKQYRHSIIVPRGYHVNRHGLHPTSLHDFVHRHVTFC